MDVFEVLERENAKILETVEKLRDATSGDRGERARLLREARSRIRAQCNREETFLYPILTVAPDTMATAQRARQESRSISALLDELASTAPEVRDFQVLAERLQSEIERHILHERTELFARARQILPPERAELIGERISGGH